MITIAHVLMMIIIIIYTTGLTFIDIITIDEEYIWIYTLGIDYGPFTVSNWKSFMLQLLIITATDWNTMREEERSLRRAYVLIKHS